MGKNKIDAELYPNDMFLEVVCYLNKMPSTEQKEAKPYAILTVTPKDSIENKWEFIEVRINYQDEIYVINSFDHEGYFPENVPELTNTIRDIPSEIKTHFKLEVLLKNDEGRKVILGMEDVEIIEVF